jgi:hypothetical protein
MSKSITAPLVGTHFHPPAKAVLPLLASGTALTLLPEPTNEYDPFAVRVLVAPEAIAPQHHPDLELHLPGWGLELSEVLAAPIFLGYIARTHSQVMVRALEQSPATASLGFSPEGKPQVHASFGTVQTGAF